MAYISKATKQPFAALASSLELTQRKQKWELSIVIYTQRTEQESATSLEKKKEAHDRLR
jgi:hypothetical protein